MNFNIAFNTIIYIMVFLFPGIIFRKFFFQGKFKNQFEHGNVLERFLWNILTSVISIFVFGIIFYYFSLSFKIQIIEKLEYKDIYDLFNDLSKNSFPKKLESLDGLKLFVFVFSFLYTCCAIAGYSIFLIVTKLKLDRKFHFFKFNNHWEYLVTVNSYNSRNLRLFKRYATFVDIMISKKDGTDLFRGRLHDIIYDKDNKIEHIALKDTLKFNSISIDNENPLVKTEEHYIIRGQKIPKQAVHIERKDKIIYKKFIDGNIFVIPNENISSINFTYVEVSNSINFKKITTILGSVFLALYLILALLLIFNIFINYIAIDSLDTFFKRALFALSCMLVILGIQALPSHSSKAVEKSKNIFYNSYFVVLVSTPFLYLFQLLNGWEFLLFIFINIIFHEKFKSSTKHLKRFVSYLLLIILYVTIFFVIIPILLDFVN